MHRTASPGIISSHINNPLRQGPVVWHKASVENWRNNLHTKSKAYWKYLKSSAEPRLYIEENTVRRLLLDEFWSIDRLWRTCSAYYSLQQASGGSASINKLKEGTSNKKIRCIYDQANRRHWHLRNGRSCDFRNLYASSRKYVSHCLSNRRHPSK